MQNDDFNLHGPLDANGHDTQTAVQGPMDQDRTMADPARPPTQVHGHVLLSASIDASLQHSSQCLGMYHSLQHGTGQPVRNETALIFLEPGMPVALIYFEFG